MSDISKRIANLSQEKQAHLLKQLGSLGSRPSIIQADQGVLTGPVPLVRHQRDMLSNMRYPHHYNVTALVEIDHSLDLTQIEHVVHHLQIHHDALRLRFKSGVMGWQAFLDEPSGKVPFVAIDLSNLAESEQRSAIATAATHFAGSLNLEEGPILNVALFTLGRSNQRQLLITINHLAADEFSINIYAENFLRAYQQLRQGKPIQLSRKGTSFKYYAEHLAQYEYSAACQEKLAAYWHSVPWDQLVSLPVDHTNDWSVGLWPSVRIVSEKLSKRETDALLQIQGKRKETRLVNLLLTVVAQAIAEWADVQVLLINTYRHGRDLLDEDVDLSRTIGCMVVPTTVVLELRSSGGLDEALLSIEHQIHQIPNSNYGCDLLSAFGNDKLIPIKLRSLLHSVEVEFNYHGRTDHKQPQPSWIKSAFEPINNLVFSAAEPWGWGHLRLYCNARIANGKLGFTWHYSENVY